MHKNIAQTHREWMTALNALNDPVFLHDKQFRILHCNEVYQQCAGIPLDELAGRPYYEIFPKAAGPLRNCLTAMEGEAGEEEVDVDGTVYRSRSFSVHDEQGVYLHSMHILEDITRYKQTEAAFDILVGTSAANVGAAFFRETVRGLSAWLGMECVIAGKLEDDGRMRALAVQRDGKTVEQHAFDLPGTTFNSLAGMGYCEYPEGVSRLHPSNKYLSGMGAEAYVGIPIRDNNGKVNGILCAISRHKTVPPPMARGVFEIIAARAGTEIERKRAEDELRQRTEELGCALESLDQAHEQLKKDYFATIHIFSNLIELRRGTMNGHSRRIAELCRNIAQGMGCTETEIQNLEIAAQLHGIGKIGLPDRLLDRPFVELSYDERVRFGKHPLRAAAILMALAPLADAAELIRYHLEHYDGIGNTPGLNVSAIPLGARILLVASDYESLQEGLIGRSKLTPDQALNMVVSARGSRYDPDVVDVFRELAAHAGQHSHAETEFKLTSGQLREHMLLTRDIMTSNGMLLLLKDSTLNMAHIREIRKFEQMAGEQLTIHTHSV